MCLSPRPSLVGARIRRSRLLAVAVVFVEVEVEVVVGASLRGRGGSRRQAGLEG